MDLLNKDFEQYLIDPHFVRVEIFYENLKEQNNKIVWSDKIDEDNFRILLIDKNENLEVLAEGLRCLSQIYINLLRDFDIFKEYPIRKYSSAYNYISKIVRFKKLLTDIGYTEKEDELAYVFKHQSNEKVDLMKKTALQLLIQFMEVMELYSLQFAGSRIIDLIDLRHENINKTIQKDKEKNMSEHEILKLFKSCHLCDADINERGFCSVCDTCVTEFKDAYKYKKVLVKIFNLNVEDFNEPPMDVKDDDKIDLEKNKERNNQVRGEYPKDEPKMTKKKDEWSCNACTFLNSDENVNCTCCGTER